MRTHEVMDAQNANEQNDGCSKCEDNNFKGVLTNVSNGTAVPFHCCHTFRFSYHYLYLWVYIFSEEVSQYRKVARSQRQKK